jgi:hypothetical protein
VHNEHDNLKAAELLVAERLRSVPLRRAPASLEARVMGAIAAGTPQPGKVDHAPHWYSGDFRRWPLHVQILFALVCVALAWLLTQPLTEVTNSAPARLGDELRSSWSVMQALATVIASLGDSLLALLRAMPTTLLVIVTGIAATSYSLLVGASALVFRSIRR